MQPSNSCCPTSLFHINPCFSLSFQSRLRPWCCLFLLQANIQRRSNALYTPPPQTNRHTQTYIYFPKLFFRGLSCVGCSLTKPIWRHPSMQRSYPPVVAVYKWGQCDTPGCFTGYFFCTNERESAWVACSSVTRPVNRFWRFHSRPRARLTHNSTP